MGDRNTHEEKSKSSREAIEDNWKGRHRGGKALVRVGSQRTRREGEK
jgi:hypothetical protein